MSRGVCKVSETFWGHGTMAGIYFLIHTYIHTYIYEQWIYSVLIFTKLRRYTVNFCPQRFLPLVRYEINHFSLERGFVLWTRLSSKCYHS